MSIKGKDNHSSMVLRIVPPSACSSKDLQCFARLVRQGKQVTSAGLEARIGAAAWLGFAWFSGKLAGVAAIKVPQLKYRDKVFSAAQAGTLAFRFPLEFGWALVTPHLRGLGIAKSLLRQLLAKTSGYGIFATTNADNQSMQKILQSSGFEVVGQPFPSDRTNVSKLLWVRQVRDKRELQ